MVNDNDQPKTLTPQMLFMSWSAKGASNRLAELTESGPD